MSNSQRSEAQIEASRHNGAKSQGPVSDEGKAASSQNAARHGLCSNKLVFDDPDARAEYERILAIYTETYIPTNEGERDCIQRMAVATWREGVAERMEVILIQAVDRREACAMTGGLGLPSLNTIMRYKTRIQREFDRARNELDDLRRHALPEREAGHIEPNSDRPEPAYRSMDEALAMIGTNEPKATANDDGLNREQRRRLEAINRKKRR